MRRHSRRVFPGPGSVCSCGLLVVLGAWAGAQPAHGAEAEAAGQAVVTGTAVLRLDGDDWLVATDPSNVGRDEGWFREPRADAKQARVPWIIQDPFPGYHGVAWYWKDFGAPRNERPLGRHVLRFWAVDYFCQVWLNGVAVGQHEGGETPFDLDVSEAIRPDAPNRLAVRVLNPTHDRIDGIVLGETPHRNKALPYSAGSAWDQGGIIDSVELLLVPAVRVEDIFARPDWRTGEIRVRVLLRNAAKDAVPGRAEVLVAPGGEGETLAVDRADLRVDPGENVLERTVLVPRHRLWDLSEPFLYRVTARFASADSRSMDERSVRAGFRDFRFEKGAFRLNGRRVWLRSSHTGNCCPVGLELPHDPDILRRDLINSKAAGFNAIRFIAGIPKRYQLDLADEIGLMVYEECYAGWCMGDSREMPRRYADSVLGMVLRDRNHPSVVIWGLLNETPDGNVFREAVGILPRLRALDDSRMVLLNSGRWDVHGGSIAGIEVWRDPGRSDPCVTRNATDHAVRALGITWQPGQLAFHPGERGEYSVVRWTAPARDRVEVTVRFESIAERATTDVHVLHGSRALHDAGINVRGGGMESTFQGVVDVEAGDSLSCVVGFGNGTHGADTTALAFSVRTSAGAVHDAAKDFSIKLNPGGPWSYGWLAPGPTPDPATFRLHASGAAQEVVGTLSNPGSSRWEDVLDDQHPYQRVPHTADIVRALRTLGSPGVPLFISEYGIGSAVDLCRAVRHYERLGKQGVEDAQLYRRWLDLFLADWERWRLDGVFARPEDFFTASNARMAGQRLLGLNAIRSNPHVVGYSLTGTVDQGMTGEGLWTTFREPKPGTLDALFDGFAPLRLCLFVEPVHVYRGARVRLEAVLANEDQLAPGDYPVRLRVVGPDAGRLLDRRVTLTIPEGAAESPFVIPVFSEELIADGPEGAYRFLASFEQGAAPTGGEAEFHVTDPAGMPPVETAVVLWGGDPELAAWLERNGIRATGSSPGAPGHREVILSSGPPPGPDAAESFRDLVRRVAGGSIVIFLSPAVFAKGNDPVGWLPLEKKGALTGLPSWLYHKDDWARRHPIFEGLPAGGLLDYAYYREIIPDIAWTGQDPPVEAVAGGINASVGYSSGLTVAVHRLGEGRLILNTLRIRENLGSNPAAERLLRNLLRDAARDAGKPTAPLPPDFDRFLGALGYGAP